MFIPSRYEKSALVNFDPTYIEYHYAVDFRNGKVRPGEISDISISLRRSSFEPILDTKDEVEFHVHGYEPYDPANATESWIHLKLVSTDGLASEYAAIIGSAGERAKTCSSKLVYGLHHCKIPSAAKEPLALSEYFYDSPAGETLIWCRLLLDGKRHCMHLFTTSFPNVLIQTDYESDAAVRDWKRTEALARPVASSFLQP